MSGIAVVDASALAALVFFEPNASVARDRLANRQLVAPRLLAYELTSAALKKLRKHPGPVRADSSRCVGGAGGRFHDLLERRRADRSDGSGRGSAADGVRRRISVAGPAPRRGARHIRRHARSSGAKISLAVSSLTKYRLWPSFSCRVLRVCFVQIRPQEPSLQQLYAETACVSPTTVSA